MEIETSGLEIFPHLEATQEKLEGERTGAGGETFNYVFYSRQIYTSIVDKT